MSEQVAGAPGLAGFRDLGIYFKFKLDLLGSLVALGLLMAISLLSWVLKSARPGAPGATKLGQQ
jgi:hypothetical protein